jgi:hypothetical protein
LKPVILLGLIAVVFVTSMIFATQVSAQSSGQGYQGGNGTGGQHQFQGTRTPVNGTYTSSNYGFQITLPSGWSGYQMSSSHSTTTRITIAPGGFPTTQGAPRPPITIGITMIPLGKTMPSVMTLPRSMQGGGTCTNATSTNVVNSMNVNVVTVDCSGTTQSGAPVTVKTQYETIQTGTANIRLSYSANPDSGFASQIATFDSMVNTLQITSAAPAVPEFPAPIVGLVVAIMIGGVVVLGRAKMIPTSV